MKHTFCNECNLSESIPRLLAEELLGIEQMQTIVSRYKIMRDNYDSDGFDWKSKDTGGIIPVTHPVFGNDFKEIGKGAIGIDFPTWFNIREDNQHIMLIAQDPLRTDPKWQDCPDAVISSPFGLHSANWRVKSGAMAYGLVQKLVAEHDLGVYLTDARKYFVNDKPTSQKHSNMRRSVYADILKKEINLVGHSNPTQPPLCVLVGREAAGVFYEIKTLIPRIVLPHFSWRVDKARYFPELKGLRKTVENIVPCYVNAITNKISMM